MAVSFSNTANPAANANFSGTSTTFSSVSFGSAATDRLIFVSVEYFSIDTTIASATIGGVTATIVDSDLLSDGSGGHIGWIWAAVPTGTSGNIVLTLNVSATSGTAVISVYRVVGADTTTPITFSDKNADAALSSLTILSAVVPTNGALLAVANAYNFSTGPTFSAWTNATADATTTWANSNSGVNGRNNVASSSASGTHNVTAAYSGTPDKIEIAVIAIQAGAVVVGDGSLMFTQALRW